MSMRIKRLIALGVCLVLLAVAVIQNSISDKAEARKPEGDGNVNVSIGIGDLPESVGEGVSKVENVDEYFASMRLDKLNDRSDAEESFNEISDNSGIETLKKIIEMENNIETGILARGYKDVFVVIDNECVYITVSTQSLDSAEASAIAVAACGITGYDMDDVVIKGIY